jgi:hypothetical protein
MLSFGKCDQIDLHRETKDTNQFFNVRNVRIKFFQLLLLVFLDLKFIRYINWFLLYLILYLNLYSIIQISKRKYQSNLYTQDLLDVINGKEILYLNIFLSFQNKNKAFSKIILSFKLRPPMVV